MVGHALNLLRILISCMNERNVHQGGGSSFPHQSASVISRAAQGGAGYPPVSCEFPRPCSRPSALLTCARLRVALADILSAVATPIFSPAKTTASASSFSGSYFCKRIVPRLIAPAPHICAGIPLQIVKLSALTLLRHSTSKQVDIALGAFDKVSAPPPIRSALSPEKSVAMHPSPLANNRCFEPCRLPRPGRRLASGLAMAIAIA